MVYVSSPFLFRSTLPETPVFTASRCTYANCHTSDWTSGSMDFLWIAEAQSRIYGLHHTP